MNFKRDYFEPRNIFIIIHFEEVKKKGKNL